MKFYPEENEEAAKIIERRKQEILKLINWFSQQIKDKEWRIFFQERLKFQRDQSPSLFLAISASDSEQTVKFAFAKTEQEARELLIHRLSSTEKNFPIFTGKVIEPPPSFLPPFPLEFPFRIVSLPVNLEDARSAPADPVEREEYIKAIERVARYFRGNYFSEIPNSPERTHNLLILDSNLHPLKVSYEKF
ncbi:MAG: hypothetical protein N2259_02510 [Patescibacteria group bacterium]|nr:hypothetical protein [Patescibacteria group bacterium]